VYFVEFCPSYLSLRKGRLRDFQIPLIASEDMLFKTFRGNRASPKLQNLRSNRLYLRCKILEMEKTLLAEMAVITTNGALSIQSSRV
jgi:hypothetical protein